MSSKPDEDQVNLMERLFEYYYIFIRRMPLVLASFNCSGENIIFVSEILAAKRKQFNFIDRYFHTYSCAPAWLFTRIYQLFNWWSCLFGWKSQECLLFSLHLIAVAKILYLYLKYWRRSVNSSILLTVTSILIHVLPLDFSRGYINCLIDEVVYLVENHKI